MRRLSTGMMWITVFWLGVAAATPAGPGKGLLLKPLKDAKGVVEPGMVVQYAPTPKKPGRLTVTTQGRSIPDVPEAQVMPYEPGAALSWAYLRLADGAGDPGYRHQVGRNVLAAVAAHPLREEVLHLWAASAAGAARQAQSGVSREEAAAACRQYLREFPRGAHRDDVEWTLCRVEKEPPDYAGSIPAMEASVRGFERFLWEHTRTPLRAEVRLRVARLCRLAAETLQDRLRTDKVSQIVLPANAKQTVTYTRADAESFMEKARLIYQELLKDSPPRVQAEARLTLLNLEHGRCLSVAPMDW